MIDLGHSHTWKPFALLGITHTFFDLNMDTIIYTWIAMGIIIGIAFFARIFIINYRTSLTTYAINSILKTFVHMIVQATDRFVPAYYYFITSLFFFILICNMLILIPGCEEPTRDLNTTIALALVSFLYTQKEIIKGHGFLGFLQEYIKMPLALIPRKKYSFIITFFIIFLRSIINLIIGILSLPLELMSKLASIISLSFRLFGNIFAGSLITTLLRQFVAGSLIKQLLVTIIPITLVVSLFFGIFESFIQAYVFAMLSLTYLSMGIGPLQETHD